MAEQREFSQLLSKQNLMFFDLVPSMPGMFWYIWNVHNLSVEMV